MEGGFPQIVDRYSWNLYPNISSIPLFCFLIPSVGSGVGLWAGGGGGGCQFFFRKSIISHFMFSSRFMLFPTFLENKIVVVLASEPVCRRSRGPSCFVSHLWLFYLPPRRRTKTGDIAMPPVRPSVRLSCLVFAL